MSNTKNNISFFLGANSAGGFVSLYDTWIDQKNTQAFYVIKGGAGCGKSTLMKTVAVAFIFTGVFLVTQNRNRLQAEKAVEQHKKGKTPT